MDTPTDPTHLFRVTLLDEPAAQERLANTLRRRVPGVVETSIVRDGAAGEVQVIVAVRGEAERARLAVARLVDVVSVEPLEPGEYVGVQLALLRIEAAGADQDEASDELARIGARLLRIGPTSLVAQIADTPETLDLLVGRLKRWGLVAVIRSGLVAIGV